VALVGRTVKRPAWFPVFYMLAGPFAGEVSVKLVGEHPGLICIQKPIRTYQAAKEKEFTVNTDDPC
jgi:hypothetical protein